MTQSWERDIATMTCLRELEGEVCLRLEVPSLLVVERGRRGGLGRGRGLHRRRRRRLCGLRLWGWGCRRAVALARLVR